MEKGELTPSTNRKSSSVPLSDVVGAAANNNTHSAVTGTASSRGKTLAGTLTDSFLNRSRLGGSKSKKHVGVEMTPYSVVPTDPRTEPDSEPQVCAEHGAITGHGGGRGRSQRLRRVSPGRRDSPGRGFDEDKGGMREDSLTASPSSATAFSVSSDDRAGLVGKPSRGTSGSRAMYGRTEGGRNNGVNSDDDDTGQGYGSDLDERRSMRRRSSSSHRDELMALVESEEPGGREGGGAEGRGGTTEFEWKTKALWYLGAFLLVAGSLVNFASFGFAPQSLLASLGSVQFISNVIFGKVRRTGSL